jgi:cell division protein FtsB
MNASANCSPKRGFAVLLGEAFSNALCSLVICYCVVSFFAGQIGLLAYRDLGATIVKMESKIGQLKADNVKLMDSKTALTGNEDRLTREARDIGFVRPGEKIVVLPSELRPSSQMATQSASRPSGSESDESLKVGLSTGLPDGFIKLLALLTSAGVFLATLFMHLSPGKRGGLETRASRS